MSLVACGTEVDFMFRIDHPYRTEPDQVIVMLTLRPTG